MDQELYDAAIRILKLYKDDLEDENLDNLFERAKKNHEFGPNVLYETVGKMIVKVLGPEKVIEMTDGPEDRDGDNAGFLPSATIFEGLKIDKLVIPEGKCIIGSLCFVDCIIDELYLPSSMDLTEPWTLGHSCFNGCQIKKLYIKADMIKKLKTKYHIKSMDDLKKLFIQKFGGPNTKIVGMGLNAKDWIKDCFEIIEY